LLRDGARRRPAGAQDRGAVAQQLAAEAVALFVDDLPGLANENR
jgi:hypothetical protein